MSSETTKPASDLAISVRDVSKVYLIYDRPQDRLRQAVIPRLKRLVSLGKPTPDVRYFREFWALKSLSFEVPRGSTVGIIGRNGSGKSTLLQIICGTLAPTTGEVSINGRVAALLELGSGFNPEFTGRENVFLNASILGLTREQTQERFESIAAFADIGDFIEQPVKTYSSGMVVRLAFAVIAHVDADILVIDEALAVGDAFFTQKCMRFLRQFMRQGTVLFVSHDSAAVTALCDRGLWLDHGALIMDAAARTVADRYLEAVVEARQGKGAIGSDAPVPSAAAADASPAATDPAPPVVREDKPGHAFVRDPRASTIEAMGLANRIELFEFNPDSSGFGIGDGRIRSVRLRSLAGQDLAVIHGGEAVLIEIEAEALGPLASPILGFLVRDRLGQHLFGDNTYLTTREQPLVLAAGSRFRARFEFQMPILPVGDYTITVALAEGTQQDHSQHHWIHDALLFRSHTSSVSHGLVGIPMRSVSMTTDTNASVDRE